MATTPKTMPTNVGGMDAGTLEYYLEGLFTKEFKRLKLLFYQYNRLLHICLPNLA